MATLRLLSRSASTAFVRFPAAYEKVLARASSVPAEQPTFKALNHLLGLIRHGEQFERMPALLQVYNEKRLPLTSVSTTAFLRKAAHYQSPGTALSYLAGGKHGLTPDGKTLEMLLKRFLLAIKRGKLTVTMLNGENLSVTDGMLATFALHESYFLQPSSKAYKILAIGCYLTNQWDKAKAVLAEMKTKKYNDLETALLELAITCGTKVSKRQEVEGERSTPVSSQQVLDAFAAVLSAEQQTQWFTISKSLIPTVFIIQAILMTKQIGLQSKDPAVQERCKRLFNQGRRDGKLVPSAEETLVEA